MKIKGVAWSDPKLKIEDIQKEMRREIKRLLRSKGCPEDKIEPLTREIVSLARIQLKDV